MHAIAIKSILVLPFASAIAPIGIVHALSALPPSVCSLLVADAKNKQPNANANVQDFHVLIGGTES